MAFLLFWWDSKPRLTPMVEQTPIRLFHALIIMDCHMLLITLHVKVRTMKLMQIAISILFILFYVCPCSHAAEKLTAATEIWEPYYGPNLKDEGMLVELAGEVLKRAGYALDVQYMSWNRAVGIVKKGKPIFYLVLIIQKTGQKLLPIQIAL
ncbi:type 2 periplasmic-binding domain-containing protein [Salidesulfovibrio brasiliensis]|uniref:hypothetical protein n=1 Tax=Salidesulfovibrio brasiliensis TaxID=221711 RepID=UPI001FE02C15|nr:hypothetical protein [Salidesulfovibrio brasiliensis]